MPTCLTKSMFTHCLECPTKLYYKTHDGYVSLQDDNEFLKALAEGGIQVGELATLYYPGGTKIEYSRDKTTSINQTNELLKQENVIIYEAAIQHGVTYALVDILVKKGNRIELIEVKSKSWGADDSFYNTNGTLKAEWHKYLYDVAFQTWVMTNAFNGFDVQPYLMLIDKDRPSTVDGLHQYFRIDKDDDGRSKIVLTENPPDMDLGQPIMKRIDVSSEVELIFNGNCRNPVSDLEALGFDQWIEGLCQLIQNEGKYPVSIGPKCKNCEHRVPMSKINGKQAGYYECWSEALSWTTADFNKPHAFDLWYADAKNLMRNEIYFMEEITPDFLGVDAETLYQQTVWDNGRKQRQLAQAMKSTGHHDASEVVLPGLFQEMDSWTYPLHFIDFEGIAPAIPLYKGTYPYRKVPFQFSIHDVHKDGSVVHTAEWIDTRRGVYACFDFVRELKKVLEKDNGSVFMYHHYEKTTLNDVKRMLQHSEEPDRDELITWIDTLVSEGEPRELIDQQRLVLRYYYSVHMGGSNSIKDVLPAVLQESERLQEIYSNPYSGLSLRNKVFYQTENGKVINPYSLLDPIHIDNFVLDDDMPEIELGSGEKITDGGAAMIAWVRMQFKDVDEEHRQHVFNALLRYCELDTLAMVMIHQHWESLRE
jgi:hypothetical protein